MGYWKNICEIQKKQTDKGINKYGQVLEENIKMTPEERITYLQEELIDGLMYCEHIKQNNYNGLTPNDYQKAALRTASDQSKENLILNGALGLSGETGGSFGPYKKESISRTCFRQRLFSKRIRRYLLVHCNSIRGHRI